MIGSKVKIIKGNHAGEFGEVLDSIRFEGISEPIWCVYLGGTDVIPCVKKELEVLECANRKT